MTLARSKDTIVATQMEFVSIKSTKTEPVSLIGNKLSTSPKDKVLDGLPTHNVQLLYTAEKIKERLCICGSDNCVDSNHEDNDFTEESCDENEDTKDVLIVNIAADQSTKIRNRKSFDSSESDKYDLKCDSDTTLYEINKYQKKKKLNGIIKTKSFNDGESNSDSEFQCQSDNDGGNSSTSLTIPTTGRTRRLSWSQHVLKNGKSRDRNISDLQAIALLLKAK
eukprot:Awhi_evm1s2180